MNPFSGTSFAVLLIGVGLYIGYKRVTKKRCKDPLIEKQHVTFADSPVSDTARAVEDDEDDLFASPPPRDGCPVCMLPLPGYRAASHYKVCCGKTMCWACAEESERVTNETNAKMKTKCEKAEEGRCPFCRTPAVETAEEILQMVSKRMDSDDANAFSLMSSYYVDGKHGVGMDWGKHVELKCRASDLGDPNSSYDLSMFYLNGKGVERDRNKFRYYLETAAKGGHEVARYNLGAIEKRRGKETLAFKHWLISAADGDKVSFDNICYGFRQGLVTKDDYFSAFRAYRKKVGIEKERRNKMLLGTI